MPSGLLLLNKPAGVRSSVCCSVARRRLGRAIKVGHGGALDSTAEGLLVLLVGGATRACELVMSLPKVYEADLALGEERTTDDYSGEPVFSGEIPPGAASLLERVLPSFMGLRMQTPPDISAVKVDGVRAHKLARSGESALLSGRPVFVRSISLEKSAGEAIHTLKVVCGKGTYIRSLARDIGRKLGCGAYISRLVRISTGSMSLETAISYEELGDGGVDLLSRLTPLSRLAENFHLYRGDDKALRRLKNGLEVRLSDLDFSQEGSVSPKYGAVVVSRGHFSFGRIQPEGFFVPVANIAGEEIE